MAKLLMEPQVAPGAKRENQDGKLEEIKEAIVREESKSDSSDTNPNGEEIRPDSSALGIHSKQDEENKKSGAHAQKHHCGKSADNGANMEINMKMNKLHLNIKGERTKVPKE